MAFSETTYFTVLGRNNTFYYNGANSKTLYKVSVREGISLPLMLPRPNFRWK